MGPKKVTLACVDLTDEDITFPEVAKNLVPEAFLKTQREKFEAARLRALTAYDGRRGKKTALMKLTKVSDKLLRAKTKRKLVNRKRRGQLNEFLAELRSREAEGYSARQLIKSHIPDIGGEVKVSDAEVTAALKRHQAAARIPNYFIIDPRKPAPLIEPRNPLMGG